MLLATVVLVPFFMLLAIVVVAFFLLSFHVTSSRMDTHVLLHRTRPGPMAHRVNPVLVEAMWNIIKVSVPLCKESPANGVLFRSGLVDAHWGVRGFFLWHRIVFTWRGWRVQAAVISLMRGLLIVWRGYGR